MDANKAEIVDDLIGLVGKIAFIAGAVIVADKHPVIAAWLVVGAFVCGTSFSKAKKSSSDGEKDKADDTD